MSEPRFYAPELAASDVEVTLSEGESRHLLRVLRLAPGTRVRAFDGRGREVRAEVVPGSKSVARLRVLEAVTPAPELNVRLTLIQAVLKGDAMDAIVRDATMLGVNAIAPAVAARTIVPARAASSETVVERWRRIAVSAAKQCGRARVPTIIGARALDDVLATVPEPRLMLVEPSAGVETVAELQVQAPPAATIVIGPEGGWTASELALARALGAQFWSLGPMTLRAEVAPVAAVSILTWLWRPTAGDLD
jgi:16S rRNA (uracil1498-N3)-methyltransferase